MNILIGKQIHSSTLNELLMHRDVIASIEVNAIREGQLVLRMAGPICEWRARVWIYANTNDDIKQITATMAITMAKIITITITVIVMIMLIKITMTLILLIKMSITMIITRLARCGHMEGGMVFISCNMANYLFANMIF